MHRRVLKFAAFCGLLGAVLAGPLTSERLLADEQPAPTPATASVEDAANAKPSFAEISIKSGYIGNWYTEDDDETRLLVLRVSVVNRHSKPITVTRAAWKLTTEGRERAAIVVPPELAAQRISIGAERVAMGDAKTEKLNLRPGGEAATWLVFKNLPDGDNIPEMSLACAIPDVGTVNVDVDETFASRLKLQSRIIGPANAIALVTIDGALDKVNVGELAKTIDQISAKQVCRVIVNFGPNATAPDREVAGWLRTVAVQSGRNPVVNDDFPALPAAIVDFHFMNFRAENSNVNHAALHSTIRRLNLNDGGRTAASRNSHDQLIAAVDSAVAPLCELLPRDELLRSVRHGGNATKAAVLRHAAERLVKTNLPLILSLTNDADLNVATAASFALRTSGDAAASQKLVTIAVTQDDIADATEKSASKIRRIVAVHSLAASKFATAHPEVIGLLATNDEFLIAETANAIVAHPRPVWSEPLAKLIKDLDKKTHVHLLPALSAVGHPRLLTILERCLKSSERALSAAALNILIARNEPAAEQLTSQWMLKSLEASAPSPVLLSFLRRTRDHRAVPLLMRHLEKKKTDRQELLTTILTIGDHRIAEQIAENFADYNFSEQLLILKALADVRSEKFWTLTYSVISQSKTSDDKSLQGVVSLLQQRGSDRAVRLLVDVLEKLVDDEQHSPRHLAVVCAALASAGTPEARDALREAVRSSESGANTARQSLAQLYQRSPAQRYVAQGGSFVGQAMRLSEVDDKIDEAEQSKRKALARQQITNAMLYLDAAVKMDPELPDARRWRANAALHIERPSAQQLEKARADFARYVELEPQESEGHTGLALVLVRQGKIDEGIAAGMAISEKSADDSVYSYNMACIYGRAIEQLESKPDADKPDADKPDADKPDADKPDQKAQIEQFRTRGVELLQQSIDSGLDDSNLGWMKRDPDLITIRKSPAFTKLVEKALGGDDKNSDDEAADESE
ncbi:MAG: hypothetical protein ACI93T_002355 [Porticoccaceae bacterium]|jgi:hypothetical protein